MTTLTIMIIFLLVALIIAVTKMFAFKEKAVESFEVVERIADSLEDKVHQIKVLQTELTELKDRKQDLDVTLKQFKKKAYFRDGRRFVKY